mmetsp:Transcript_1027/g.1604  ORF Transcript_1027/g.1604 Transcript_1027/m.1604 type:complete len:303 (+) Transcript_1027:76-984(+)|eukprot:CAMPEP_0115099546 /NCGR_PEP_ID=MMETSP0227-20121206/31931_1 /TAXON_ID=89957 /ORGANISM="Polarella glacialis, Strain CCMP 1383" /LENGTH=302 /DNA_ID=CAMNT_0002494587 /DNA_START=72 /DNA_END=980 /DNA_ORIENTATION=-
MAESSLVSEYLCTLQLPEGSPLKQELLACRSAVAKELLADETGLYPPHISVTGFFSATPEQADAICCSLREILASSHRRCGSLQVEFRQIVCMSGGHVLVDVHAPELAVLAAKLAEKANELGVRGVRPKGVRHLSLASQRSPDEQQRVTLLHAALEQGYRPSWGQVGHSLELVLARLDSRSNLERLRRDGQAHIFHEVLRIPVETRCAMPGARDKLHRLEVRLPRRLELAPDVAVLDAVTPVRKRTMELIFTSDGQSGEEITPPKFARFDGAPPGKPLHQDLPILCFADKPRAQEVTSPTSQ